MFLDHKRLGCLKMREKLRIHNQLSDISLFSQTSLACKKIICLKHNTILRRITNISYGMLVTGYFILQPMRDKMLGL